ncbi:MAG: hypothetical protein AVDCRST_MAG49-262, partial [uncultured Thermomicrobiales bacterium]
CAGSSRACLAGSGLTSRRTCARSSPRCTTLAASSWSAASVFAARRCRPG